MPGGQGLRHRTRDLFQRGFRQKGFIPLTTYLRTYKLGDYVDIKMNPAQQKVRWIVWCTVDKPSNSYSRSQLYQQCTRRACPCRSPLVWSCQFSLWAFQV